MSGRVERVLVIGLDSATPQFVFGPDRFDLPNLQGLASRGCWGLLESCHPPITIPAWTSMMSGKDPGTLGVYGFQNRRDHSYAGMTIADSTAVKEPRVWDILSQHGKKVVVLGVPQTYPVTAVNGCMVADFLAPDTSVDYTYPRALKAEIEAARGEYLLDVKDFRTNDKGRLLGQIYALMENRFDVARHLMTTHPWDFFMMVEMGVDRLHHGFWRFSDPEHPKFELGHAYRYAIRDYYRALDERVGEIISLLDEKTAILVVSDHGAKKMAGGICLNQWLINEGFLTMAEPVRGVRRIEDCRIDWSNTTAWGSGGYYGRVFLNVQGREPEGTILRHNYESFRDALVEKIEAMVDHMGHPLGNRAYKPEDLYKKISGVAPDLIVYFGDLNWRSVGAVGFDSLYVFENDTGPDDANHDYHGIFLMDDRSNRGGDVIKGLQLMDVASTVLDLFGIKPPGDMQGRAVRLRSM